MLSFFDSLWMIYVSVLISFHALELQAIDCYRHGRYEGLPVRSCWGKKDPCFISFRVHELQNFYWDLFLEEKKTQQKTDQMEPSDELDVMAKLANSGGCSEDYVPEDSYITSQATHCKIVLRPYTEEEVLYCYCFEPLCNGPDSFKIPRNFIRNAGQRQVICFSVNGNQVLGFDICPINQLCTYQFDIDIIEQITKTNTIGMQISMREIPFEARLFSGCTNDPNPLLLSHTKGECAFSGDLTNQSVWTCRCNTKDCNNGLNIMFLKDDLLAFPGNPNYDESRIRCLSSNTNDGPVLDKIIVWCEPHEMCSVRIDLIKKNEPNELEQSVVYQGCYSPNSSERNVIVSEDGDDCRDLDFNTNLTWLCVCTNPLCNWYKTSRLVNPATERKNKERLDCYTKQEIIQVPNGHFCSVHVSFAMMKEHYQDYAKETKLEQSAASLEEPLKLHPEFIFHQGFEANTTLTNSLKVGRECAYSFTEKQNNENLWVCFCNVSLCNAIEIVRFMPNELRQNNANDDDGDDDDDDKDDFANKPKQQLAIWIILVIRVLLNN